MTMMTMMMIMMMTMMTMKTMMIMFKQVVGMEEGESDYSVVHLGPETQGLPAFHRIVGEDEVTLFVTP